MEAFESFEHWGVKVELFQDDDAGNPYVNMEQASRIVGLEPLHREGWSEEEYPTTEDRDLPVLLRWLTLFGGEAVAIPFEFHDYGSSGYKASLVSPHYGEAAGFVCVSREKMIEEWPTGITVDEDGETLILSPVEAAERCARAEFETWAAWLEGDVAGYVVDRGGPDASSCWGFYGPDAERYAAEDGREAAEFAAHDKALRYAQVRTYLLDPDPPRVPASFAEWKAEREAVAA